MSRIGSDQKWLRLKLHAPNGIFIKRPEVITRSANRSSMQITEVAIIQELWNISFENSNLFGQLKWLKSLPGDHQIIVRSVVTS